MYMGYYQPNKEKADYANGGNYITANRMTENIKGNRNTQGCDKIQNHRQEEKQII